MGTRGLTRLRTWAQWIALIAAVGWFTVFTPVAGIETAALSQKVRDDVYRFEIEVKGQPRYLSETQHRLYAASKPALLPLFLFGLCTGIGYTALDRALKQREAAADRARLLAASDLDR